MNLLMLLFYELLSITLTIADNVNIFLLIYQILNKHKINTYFIIIVTQFVELKLKRKISACTCNMMEFRV